MTSSRGGRSDEVRREAWVALGEFLAREDLLLVPEARRVASLREWRDVRDREAHLDDTIVIGLVGGTGVGKSTFINALARGDVSRVGDRRPTTDRVVVYRHVATDLAPGVPTSDLSQPQVLHENEFLERVVLLDFPDFDSADRTHAEILERYLGCLDVLFIVVDDMKYGDRRLFELLGALPHNPRNLFTLLNKVDRLVPRYGDRWAAIASEILADFREKLSIHGGMQLDPTQTLAISALAALEHRRDGSPRGVEGAFDGVEQLLDGFREEKRRKAAKELNLESRRRGVVDGLRLHCLSPEVLSVVDAVGQLVASHGAELQAVLDGISVDVLTDAERRARRRACIRRVGPGWGFPFSLLATLAGELFKSRAKDASGDDAELAPRIARHYRVVFDSLRNFESALRVEFAGSSLAERFVAVDAPGSAASHLEPKALERRISEIATHLERAISAEETVPSGRRRLLYHVPALATLTLGIWSLFYPLVQSLASEGWSWSGLLGKVVKALVEGLNPFFIVSLLLGVVLAYGVTGIALWMRAAQKLDGRLSGAERNLRTTIRAMGDGIRERAEARVAAYREELARLEVLVGTKAPEA